MAKNSVQLEKISYAGWPNCLRLANGQVELVVTLDVGPRVIRYGLAGGGNVFKEFADQIGRTSGDEWLSFGGHRLWHAPEESPRTYVPDFDAVKHTWSGGVLKLVQPTEPSTGVQKEIDIHLAEDHVHLEHRLINRNVWPIELAPWSISVMAGGGRAILPQEKFIPHPQVLLPARALVLWHYTKMNDPRFSWGERFIQFREDPAVDCKQKFGAANTLRWAAYNLGDNLFIKTFDYFADQTYPDHGCNCEFYTQPGFLEVETLGPLVRLEPGQAATHTECWHLWKAGALPTDDTAIEKALVPYLKMLKYPATPTRP